MSDLNKLQTLIRWELLGLKIRRQRLIRYFVPRFVLFLIVLGLGMWIMGSDEFAQWFMNLSGPYQAAFFIGEIALIWWFRGLCVKWEKGIKEL